MGPGRAGPVSWSSRRRSTGWSTFAGESPLAPVCELTTPNTVADATAAPTTRLAMAPTMRSHQVTLPQVWGEQYQRRAGPRRGRRYRVRHRRTSPLTGSARKASQARAISPTQPAGVGPRPHLREPGHLHVHRRTTVAPGDLGHGSGCAPVHDHQADALGGEPAGPLGGRSRRQRPLHGDRPRVLPAQQPAGHQQPVAGDVVGRQVAAQRVQHLVAVVPGGCAVAGERQQQHVTVRAGRHRPVHPGPRRGVRRRVLDRAQPAGQPQRGVRQHRERSQHQRDAPRRPRSPGPASGRPPPRRRTTPCRPGRARRAPASGSRPAADPAPGTWATAHAIGPGAAQVRAASPSPAASRRSRPARHDGPAPPTRPARRPRRGRPATTSATQASSPVRDAGTTSAFQMPPRPRAASGAGSVPSPRSAKTSAPAGVGGRRRGVQQAGDQPRRVRGQHQGRRVTATAAERRSSRRPAATTADASPAPALRLPSGSSHHTARGTPVLPPGARRRRAPATAARRTRPAPASARSAAARPRTGSTRPGTTATSRAARESPGRAARPEAGGDQAAEQHRLLQQHPRDDLVEHRHQRVGGDRARQPRPEPEERPGAGRRSGTQTMS